MERVTYNQTEIAKVGQSDTVRHSQRPTWMQKPGKTQPGKTHQREVSQRVFRLKRPDIENNTPRLSLQEVSGFPQTQAHSWKAENNTIFYDNRAQWETQFSKRRPETHASTEVNFRTQVCVGEEEDGHDHQTVCRMFHL